VQVRSDAVSSCAAALLPAEACASMRDRVAPMKVSALHHNSTVVAWLMSQPREAAGEGITPERHHERRVVG
jgi:hypothetical protein